MSHSPGFLKMVNDSKSKIQELTIDKVANMMEKSETFFLVDTREDNEWNAGRIRGAIHIGKGIIERDIETQIPDKSAKIILYCGGGFRSAIAAESIQKMGYTDVYSMDGGIRGWREKDLPENRG